MGYSIDRTKIDQWGFNLTWQGMERAGPMHQTVKNYVESLTERQFVEQGINGREEDIEGGGRRTGGGGGEDEDGR